MPKNSQLADVQAKRKFLCDSYKEIAAFPISSPGDMIYDNEIYDFSKMSNLFREKLIELVKQLFGQENITVKEYNGRMLTAVDLINYVVVWEKKIREFTYQDWDSQKPNPEEFPYLKAYLEAEKNFHNLVSKIEENKTVEELKELMGENSTIR